MIVIIISSKLITVDYNQHYRFNTMVMTLILISSKLVDIPKNAGIFAMQLYWNHTSAWVIPSMFASFLQNTFSEEHLWRAASEHEHCNKKHIHTEHVFLSIY